MVLRKARAYLSGGIWETDLSALSPLKRLLVYLARAVVLALGGMSRNRVSIWAASLTYVTLISVIPFVALAAGVSSWFGVPGKGVERIKAEIPEAQREILDNIVSQFQATDLKALGVVSVLLLLYAMVKALTGIEKAFNAIWGVERGRSLGRRISNYVTVAVVGPLLAMAAISLTATAGVGAAHQSIHAVLPYVSIGVLLALLYWLMPNTRVRLPAALLGAVLAAALWMLAMKTYVGVQVGLSKYDPFYGAYAAIPAFLVWVYVSWLVVLFGTELCYAAQHVRSYGFERGEAEPSQVSVERSGLRITLLLASRFEGGGDPLDADEVAEQLGLPARFANRVLGQLVESGIVGELEAGGYQIGKSPRVLTAADVVSALRSSGEALESRRDFPEGAHGSIERLTESSLRPLRVPIAELLSDGEG
ncbi:MAG: YhjD/YihY/BrkB family envelope integrity protein [Planctomycetota bacterium]|jgi:membrane protein